MNVTIGFHDVVATHSLQLEDSSVAMFANEGKQVLYIHAEVPVGWLGWESLRSMVRMVESSITPGVPADTADDTSPR